MGRVEGGLDAGAGSIGSTRREIEGDRVDAAVGREGDGRVTVTGGQAFGLARIDIDRGDR